MNVLIVGGGRLGTRLAEQLLSGGHEVVVVEKDQTRAEELRSRLTGITVVHGDGDEPAVLEGAHVSSAQALAAMTDEDEDNLVACLLARREYGVASTFARVNDPRNEWLFGERFGVDYSMGEASMDASEVAKQIATVG